MHTYDTSYQEKSDGIETHRKRCNIMANPEASVYVCEHIRQAYLPSPFMAFLRTSQSASALKPEAGVTVPEVAPAGCRAK